LADETFLSDDLLRQLMSVGEVDLLVGILSHRSANTMRRAAHYIETSLQQNFVRQRVAIISVDGGAVEDSAFDDRTGVEQPGNNSYSKGISALRTIHRVTAGFSGAPSPGLALRTILSSADLLRAKACAVVSPATSSTSPEWVANLLRPAFRDNFDFVAPLYSRHKFQGLLARNLLYPMTRALFGRRIRELYSDEWAFSNRLGNFCVNEDVWHEEPVRSRPEAWMGISALTSDFRCCQVYLGEKPPPPNGAGPDLVEVLRQTVGSLFWLLETHQQQWMERQGSEPLPTFGPDHAVTAEPMELNNSRMFEMFQTGVKELEPILEPILSPDTLSSLKGIATLEQHSFRFPEELWVTMLYEFAASFHHSVINRDHLVQALVPLYRGKIYSFLTEFSQSSASDMEAVSENLCLEFERQKPYLTEKWKAGVEVKS
jgi:glucosylglycerate synthase